MATLKVCAVGGCPNLSQNRLCKDHRRAKEALAGSRQARGYDATHTALRERLRPSVEQGIVTCWRCGRLIEVGEPWDLGHDDTDRTKYRGPEHRGRCNRATAGRRKR